MKPSCKRLRISLDIVNDDGDLDESEIDDALKSILLSGEVVDPTRRKIRRALQSKLETSKTMIKKHKKLIDKVCYGSGICKSVVFFF